MASGKSLAVTGDRKGGTVLASCSLGMDGRQMFSVLAALERALPLTPVNERADIEDAIITLREAKASYPRAQDRRQNHWWRPCRRLEQTT